MSTHGTSSPLDMEDDSPWQEFDEEEGMDPAHASTAQISEQEYLKLSQRYSDVRLENLLLTASSPPQIYLTRAPFTPQAGYRDGIAKGKQSALQKGFDEGFQLSSPYARQLGSLQGITSSLLALLSTTSSAKHIPPALQTLLSDRATKDEIIANLRELVQALGKLEEGDVVPVDLEAEAHVREHEEEGMSDEMVQKREMKRMEKAMNGLGGGVQKKLGMLQCQEKLRAVLVKLGMESMLDC